MTEAKGKHLAKQEPKTPPDPAKPNPTMSEEELFSDPRASLDKIAGVPPPGPRLDPTATLKGYGEVGPSADEALRDPFRPLGSDRAINVVKPGSCRTADGRIRPSLTDEAVGRPSRVRRTALKAFEEGIESGCPRGSGAG